MATPRDTLIVALTTATRTRQTTLTRLYRVHVNRACSFLRVPSMESRVCNQYKIPLSAFGGTLSLGLEKKFLNIRKDLNTVLIPKGRTSEMQAGDFTAGEMESIRFTFFYSLLCTIAKRSGVIHLLKESKFFSRSFDCK